MNALSNILLLTFGWFGGKCAPSSNSSGELKMQRWYSELTMNRENGNLREISNLGRWYSVGFKFLVCVFFCLHLLFINCSRFSVFLPSASIHQLLEIWSRGHKTPLESHHPLPSVNLAHCDR